MTQQATHATSVALCVTDRPDLQHRPQTKPTFSYFGLELHGTLICRFIGPYPCNLFKYMDYNLFINCRGTEG